MERYVLITGGIGFIGFHLCKFLLEQNISVIAIDNLNDYYDINLKNARLEILKKYSNFNFIKCDIADNNSLERVFKDYTPQIVVNLAAQAGVRYSIENPRAYLDSNLIGFFNILECCRHYPVEHLLFASSSSVYGNQSKIPFSVDDNVDHPISLYAATKKSNELLAYSYAHLYNIPSTGLRFFTVYGPFGRPDMAYFSFTNKIVHGEVINIFNNGDMLRDFTYIDDIVMGISKMIYCPPKVNSSGDKYKIYNIGNNKPEKLLDFVNILEQELDIKAKKQFFPMQPGDVYQTYADVSELEKDFGFRPKTSLKIGLKKFVAWYKEFYKITK